MQRLIEDRKLAHRRSIAEHLREVGARNGNENLMEVADRMERKAEEHYEKRLAKIDGAEPPTEPVADFPISPDQGAALGNADVTDSSPADTDGRTRSPAETGKLTGRENALQRQLRNEERKLEHRLDTAQHLRELAELNGDEELLAAAERLEETALSHYEARLTKIGEFADRFDLQDVSGTVIPD
jgi:hypothetical protein